MAHVLITGSTGMVGKAVLLESIQDPAIHTITLINRSPVDIQDKKIREIILPDFAMMDQIRDRLGKPDGCFHCMGVSALGMSEEQYSKLTYDISKALVDICFEINPQMTFSYVSGAGTDTAEKGRQMWARVKGKTENYMLAKGFQNAYMFRPGFIIPEKGIRSRTSLYQGIYNIMRPFFPWLRKMKNVTTTTRIGQVMINTVLNPPPDITYLENHDINRIAAEHSNK